MQTSYEKGRSAEYAVVKKLRDQGYLWIIRSAASHTPIDLLVANKEGEVLAVQVKAGRSGAYLSYKERSMLNEWARRFKATPTLAFKKKGRWSIQNMSSKQFNRTKQINVKIC